MSTSVVAPVRRRGRPSKNEKMMEVAKVAHVFAHPLRCKILDIISRSENATTSDILHALESESNYNVLGQIDALKRKQAIYSCPVDGQKMVSYRLTKKFAEASQLMKYIMEM